MNSELIIGTILGDGHIDKIGSLACEHSVLQADYFYWKYDLLSHLCRFKPKITHKGRAIRFRTRALFKDERELWYGTGRKALPSNFADLLSPKALAVWFMDDGDKKTGRVVRGYWCCDTGMRMSTHSFNRKEHRLITEVLIDLFGIKATYKRKGKYLRLHIPAKNGNSKKFADLIRPFMPDCMRYKLPMFRIDRRGRHGNQAKNRNINGQFIKSESAETRQGAVLIN